MSGERLFRVSKRAPCPICGRSDWCGLSHDGAVCVCMREEQGAKKRSANGGYVHVLCDDGDWRKRPKVRTSRVKTSEPKRRDFDKLALQYQKAVEAANLKALGDSLGLSVANLRRLRIGWAAYYGAWSFPMMDSSGWVIGIRLRFSDGRKLSVTGGHEGFFIPDGLCYGGPLLIAEGPTDCTALLDLGFEAIGRPSCVGGVAHCVELVRAHYPLDVVVVADADPPGQRGAGLLASSLLAYCPSVRVIRPPDHIKDIRDWKRTGVTHKEIQEAIDAAAVRRVSVTAVRHGN